MLRIAFSFLLLLCLVSCESKIENTFNIVESVMDTQPDSALALLKNIEQKELSSEFEKAKYALLYSQALDKNYIDVTNDSLIRIAVDHFEKKDNCREKMLSYYYLARIYYNDKSYLQSLKASLEAEIIAKDIKDYYNWGLVGLNIIDIYDITRLHYDMLKETNITIQAFETAKKDRHLDWTHYYKAYALIKCDSLNVGKCLLDSIYNVASIKNDKGLMETCLHLYVNYYNILKNDSILIYLDKISRPTDSDYINMQDYYLSKNNLDSAKLYHEKTNIAQTDYMNNFHKYEDARYYYKAGDYENAYNLLNKAMVDFVSLYESYMRTGISAYQKDFYQNIAEKEKMKAKQNRLLTIIILTGVIFVGTFVVVRHKKQIKQKKEELATTLELVSSLKKELDENKNETDSMAYEINELLRNHFETVTGVCDIYHQIGTDKQTEEDVYLKIKDIVEKFQQEKKIIEIKKIIEKYNGKELASIYNDAANKNISFSNRENSVFLLLISGLSSTTIAFLLNLSMPNYYTIKNRLKKRLLEIDSEMAMKIYNEYF